MKDLGDAILGVLGGFIAIGAIMLFIQDQFIPDHKRLGILEDRVKVLCIASVECKDWDSAKKAAASIATPGPLRFIECPKDTKVPWNCITPAVCMDAGDGYVNVGCQISSAAPKDENVIYFSGGTGDRPGVIPLPSSALPKDVKPAGDRTDQKK